MEKQKHYYTEPRKETFYWVVEQRAMNGILIKKHEFNHNVAAWGFLNKVTVEVITKPTT